MFKLMKKITLMGVALFTVCIYTPNANAENMLNVGAGGVWKSSPYKDHDNTIFPFPMIRWEAKHVYIRGFSAGVFLWTDDNEMNELSLGIKLGALVFDNDKTDDVQLARLDDRDSTIDAYIQYIVRTEFGTIGARFSHDTLGNADGFVADIFYRYPIRLNSFSIAPGAGLQWDSSERVEHFYGVSSSEARRSGLSTYEPDAALSPFLSLDLGYAINERIRIFAAGKVNFLSDEIQDSPMVDESKIVSTTFGATYSF